MDIQQFPTVKYITTIWMIKMPGTRFGIPEGNVRDYQLPENIALNKAGITRGRAYEAANVSDSTYFDGKIANKGIEDLRKLKGSDAPFFLALGFLKPHLPFNAPTKYWELYDEKEIRLT